MNEYYMNMNTMIEQYLMSNNYTAIWIQL